jgi:hypothetical protein
LREKRRCQLRCVSNASFHSAARTRRASKHFFKIVRMPEPHKSFETLRALATSKDRDAGLSEAPHTYCGAVGEIKCHDATCLRHQWRMHSPPCLRAASVFEGPSLVSSEPSGRAKLEMHINEGDASSLMCTLVSSSSSCQRTHDYYSCSSTSSAAGFDSAQVLRVLN